MNHDLVADGTRASGVPAQRQTPEGQTASVPAPKARWRPWMTVLVVLLFLGQMAVGMITAAREQSTTIDEPVYLGTAVTYVRDHRLAYNYEHPPLAKLIIATGMVFADVHVSKPYPQEQWALGHAMLYENGNDPQHVLFAARLPMIVLTLLFGLVVFAFARDLTGSSGGLLALALYAFSPDVLAYGSLAGVDLPTAGFLLTGLWLLWRARSRPYLNLPLSGIALGAAAATKMSALPALPIAALLVVLSVWHAGRLRVEGRPSVVRLLVTGVAAAAGVVAVAIVVVWVSYLIVDPRLRWSTPPGLAAISGVKAHVVDLLPFPRPFRDGMRFQFKLEDGDYSGYIFGKAYIGTRWYYVPGALLIKEPLGMLGLWLIGAAGLLISPRLRAAAAYLLLPTLLLTLIAMTGARNWGVRYTIFIPVILAVAAASVAAYRSRWLHVTAGLLAVFVAVSSVRAFPYYLPYSNEAFGGPSRTYTQLTDSNVDWGQDLARLGKKYPGRPIWLIYKGRGEPAGHNINARDPFGVPLDQVHGTIAISGRCIATPNSCLPVDGDRKAARRQFNELLATSLQIGNVGYSILLYQR
ncbi:glycosyltransferase family 39 protein [Actinoplanes sp. L3-i22]|uniref:ArnT family glycosyltransferase n=1 Tax=Actinoplanes sp. L3-i22 TaxID=2836373 RepID=UPI001C773DBB|nr:phospholipid carrier-dependent glycosyltransferase [Actinoplanes sp. L3-i22]BCY09133.1 glycosyl transferase [Actinoplanes sp. L3-i22]